MNSLVALKLEYVDINAVTIPKQGLLKINKTDQQKVTVFIKKHGQNFR